MEQELYSEHFSVDEAGKLRMDGVDLTEEITSGKSLLPGFSRELLDKVLSLGFYSLFMLFTAEEFK